MALGERSTLRPPCRVPAGASPSTSCPIGTAGYSPTGQLDLADLVANPRGREIWARAVDARYEIEQAGGSQDEALRAYHAIVDPAIASINDARDARIENDRRDAQLENQRRDAARENEMKRRHGCKCQDTTDDLDDDEDCCDPEDEDCDPADACDDENDDRADAAMTLANPNADPIAKATARRRLDALAAARSPHRGQRAVARATKATRADAAPAHGRFVDQLDPDRTVDMYRRR